MFRMPRTLNGACAALAFLGVAAQVWPSRAEDLPIMYTYEARKQRLEALAAARDPKRFWIRQVFNRIESKIADLPKPLKESVTVRLNFSVAHDGRLLSKAIISPSGDETADKAAVTMLERAAPFPPMPDAMSDAEMTFALPVRFR